jgi:hypothetical protein
MDPVSFNENDHGKIVCTDIKLAQRFVDANIDLRLFNISCIEALCYPDVVEFLIRNNCQVNWTIFKYNLRSKSPGLDTLKKFIAAIAEANIEPFNPKARCKKILNLVRFSCHNCSKSIFQSIIDYVSSFYPNIDVVEMLLSTNSALKYFRRNDISLLLPYILDPVSYFRNLLHEVFYTGQCEVKISSSLFDRNFFIVVSNFNLSWHDLDVPLAKIVEYGFAETVKYFQSQGWDIFDDTDGQISWALKTTRHYEIFTFYAGQNFQIDFSTKNPANFLGIFVSKVGFTHDRKKVFELYYADAMKQHALK